MRCFPTWRNGHGPDYAHAADTLCPYEAATKTREQTRLRQSQHPLGCKHISKTKKTYKQRSPALRSLKRTQRPLDLTTDPAAANQGHGNPSTCHGIPSKPRPRGPSTKPQEPCGCKPCNRPCISTHVRRSCKPTTPRKQSICESESKTNGS